MSRISKATAYNWKKLGSNPEVKLTKRANKTQSKKRILALSYLNNDEANLLLEEVSGLEASIDDIMYSLAVSYLRSAHIYDKKEVQAFLAKYAGLKYIDIKVPDDVWNVKEDILGFIYQSLMPEGERISFGQYYTNKQVVACMLNEKKLLPGETFLDPCCGSGAFLMGVKTHDPLSLYGFDINPIAVLIASTNLLVKYADFDFIPNIYCLDFLKNDLSGIGVHAIPSVFDYIYTNPPWGADKDNSYTTDYPLIKSKERASMMMIQSLRHLSHKGELCFLLPNSLLKIKTHSDIRNYILQHTAIEQIDLYTHRFDGVFTDYFSIRLTPRQVTVQCYKVVTGQEVVDVTLSDEDCRGNRIVIERLSEFDHSILKKMEACRHDNLTHSRWALGIVTGDNKNKVKQVPGEGMEPVYTGKDVQPFLLQPVSMSYILFEPDAFQQCAKEEFFRAPEKLIYRFIAKCPIVAYDDKQCLCLNSANILIPELDGISVKSVAALLNSSLYRYYYSKKFADIKILKSNLQKLPFPRLTSQQDRNLSKLVDEIRCSREVGKFMDALDNIVYALFGITPEEQEYIMQVKM